MKMNHTNLERRRGFKALWFVLIVMTASTIGMIVDWRAPELHLYSQDLLMRSRGLLPEPENIVIVAIDDPSIAKLGRFPWSRKQTAQAIDMISSAKPGVIALDILFSEPTDQDADKALADAVKRSGNVVIGEQLVENRDTPELGRAEWLKAMPTLRSLAAGVGHVNVETEHDGSAREMLLKIADDKGEPRWALAVETVRVSDGSSPDDVSETAGFVRIGTRRIPFVPIERNLFLKTQDADSRLTIAQPLRMTIDYIGPAGSFGAQTYSISDVLEGKVSPEKFRGKYVLIGATAATLGDRIATPFVHAESADGDQHGDLMPGVEILANSVNTILRNRFYRPVSDWMAALLAMLTASAVILLLGFAQGKFEAFKQIGVLAGLFGLLLFGSYLTFVYGFVVPPLVPMVASFAVATPLALLRRSISASINLDERITELLAADNRLFTNGSKRFLPEPDRPRPGTSEEFEPSADLSAGKFYLPRGLEWKSNALGFLSRDLIARALFIDRSLRSIEDGLLIADIAGQIIFANQSALCIFNLPERRLLGRNIFTQIAEAENKTADSTESAEEMLAQLLIDQNSIEREIAVGKKIARYYYLRMAAVVGRIEDEGDTLGIVATLSDVTHHRELQKTKNDVIALVTHELRTPLTAIQGMSEVLTEHDVEPEPQRKMLVTINTEAKRLANMINEYLDITRLEAGVQNFNFTLINIESLIDRTLLLLEPLAAKREIKILSNFQTHETTISADAERLAQMLTNIVANAVKYSPRKTAITVETHMENDTLQIIVVDEGYGISPEQLPRIFEKFYRTPQRNAGEIQGTGLGLALAREIAELHGGHISAASELNKGSTFTIHLPVSQNI